MIGDGTRAAVYVKKRRIVQGGRGWRPRALLETQEDVDAYLGKLRQALEAAIKAGERVEIR